MRDILADIAKHTMSMFKDVKVTGVDGAVRFEADDAEDKSLLMTGCLKNPCPDMNGEFGLSNLPKLNSLLNFPTYKDHPITATRRVVSNGQETVTEFRFLDAHGTGSNFKTKDPGLLPPSGTISGKIPWTLTLTPTRSKMVEFSQLAGVYSEHAHVAPYTDKGNLIFALGKETATTDNATMVFATEVAGSFRREAVFNVRRLLSVFKAVGSTDPVLKLSERGVLAATLSTDIADYTFYIRAFKE